MFAFVRSLFLAALLLASSWTAAPAQASQSVLTVDQFQANITASFQDLAGGAAPPAFQLEPPSTQPITVYTAQVGALAYEALSFFDSQELEFAAVYLPPSQDGEEEGAEHFLQAYLLGCGAYASAGERQEEQERIWAALEANTYLDEYGESTSSTQLGAYTLYACHDFGPCYLLIHQRSAMSYGLLAEEMVASYDFILAGGSADSQPATYANLPSVSPVEYGLINRGMTYDEVTTVFGGRDILNIYADPNAPINLPEGTVVYVWESEFEKEYVAVTFMNGRVLSVSLSGDAK